MRRQLVFAAAALSLCLGGGLAVADETMAEDPHADSHAAGAHGEDAHAEGAHEEHGPTPINWIDLGYKSKNVHGENLEEKGGEPMAPPFVLALLNFAIFIGLLVWKAGPPIQRALSKRHIAVKEALEEGARLRREAQEKLDDYNARIKNVDAEVAELVAQIRKDAEEERERILAAAKAQAEAVEREAKSRIENEIAKARHELEAEVVAAAVKVAEKLITEKSTKTDKKQLFDGFIADLKSSQSQETSR